MNLEKLVSDKVKELGQTKSVDYFVNPVTKKKVSLGTIKNWINGNVNMPAWAAQTIIDKEGLPVDTNPLQPSGLMWEGKKLIIGFPSYKTTNPNTMFSICALLSKHSGKVGIDMEIQTLIIQARNILATRFMNSKAEWLLFLDDDMLFPCGVPQIYNGRWNAKAPAHVAETDLITQLISHGKPLVSGLYFGRDRYGTAQYGDAFEQFHENDYAHKNAYKNELRKVKWAGAGCLLIHRSVFEAIEKTFPEVDIQAKGRSKPYFTPLTADQGEDVAFCLRAKKAGIDCYVDFAAVCGHIGSQAFWNHNTTSVKA